MDLRTVAIALGVFVLICGGFLAFVIVYTAGGTSSSTTAGERPENDPRKQMEDYVLDGFTVAFWAEGRPFVNYTDSMTDEVIKQDIFQALFWMAQAADDLTGTRHNGGPVDSSEAAYRLALLYEYGLFRYDRDPGEALRYYRFARVGGHARGDAAATRLESAGQ